MIVSFSRNFIFLKTHKTASTSIELALTPYCGPEDIIAPTAFEDERARMIDGVVQARNYADEEHEAAFASAVMAGDEKGATDLLRKFYVHARFYNHMPAANARGKLPAAFWSKAYKFTVERHPYEKAVSWAYFLLATKSAHRLMIGSHIEKSLGKVNDAPIYTIDGRLAVDRVIRYESLESEFAEVVAHLGLSPLALPRAKGHFRADRRSAREILTPEQRRFVASTAKQTFEMFGYLP